VGAAEADKRRGLEPAAEPLLMAGMGSRDTAMGEDSVAEVLAGEAGGNGVAGFRPMEEEEGAG
jgi:hypothetical protein